ncbi:MAG: hypothetical protein UU32_C0005G0016 [Candidatus Woesebacteria bacterium GW2011_GWB1_41_10]|uniref:Uncharacterized protein n=1 Tax=Candidatus Woesebacteria bacterium GW2011_GWB1_41_10 TaxID=1618577 RepID=A0A0G0XIC5_9BACT|nr:MAG: hypothetical protein UU32_C0005G0016 [Candidatus Woesebacteria bacterium GW2011_GWB1_41_10]KKS88133.1 MAG: hypothetical protein UV64_C0029G0006 [Parcubacteria group bacterium GW2011_GWC1_43_11b]
MIEKLKRFFMNPVFKKYLPFILLGVGVLILAGAFLLIKNSKEVGNEDETVKEIPVEQRPIVSLIPSGDGHWLKLKIEQIKVEGAVSLDYELLYTLPDGRVQGVPGTVKIKGDVIRDLLLGSESSGKFRYDEGVETGSMTVRFRNLKGKLIGKLSTKFHMQTGVKELTSADGKFTYSPDKISKGVYYVTMETFAEPNPSTVVVYKDGYGVFSSQ